MNEIIEGFYFGTGFLGAILFWIIVGVSILLLGNWTSDKLSDWFQ